VTAITTTCPRCNALVKFGNRNCEYCGAEILFEEAIGEWIIYDDGEDDVVPPNKIAIRDIKYGFEDGMKITQVDAVEFVPISDMHVGVTQAKEVEYIAIDFGPDIFKPKPPPRPTKTERDLLILGIVFAVLYSAWMIGAMLLLG